jgi:4,5-dihydroxyphthalate decarboxylase
MEKERVTLTLATGSYDRTIGLKETLSEEGLDVRHLFLTVDEIFWRMIRYKDFDAAEMSLAAYAIQRSRGDRSLVGIPVFPSKIFRHGSLYINPSGPVDHPAELRGKRIGVPEYQMTAAVWIRGFLSHDYGVPAEELRWVTGGVDQPGREERIPLPPEIEVYNVKNRALGEMLLAGEIDALISARMPEVFLQGKAIRLFSDYRSREREWFARTKIVPIMHLVVLKKEIVESYPWIPGALYRSFCNCLHRTLREMYDTDAWKTTLVWLSRYVEEEMEIFGGDLKKAWDYGLTENELALQRFLKYLKEQKLLAKEITLKDLFPETLL